MLRDNHRDEVLEILSRYPEKRAAMLPMLYLAQDKEYGGWLPEEAINEVAAILELDPTEVYAVSEFYSLFYHQPVGTYLIRYCTDMPCALVGAEPLYAHLLQRLGLNDGQTTPDGLFTAEACVCLAACGTAPVMQINRQFFENLTAEKIDAILEQVRASGLPTDGPGLHFQPRE